MRKEKRRTEIHVVLISKERQRDEAEKRNPPYM
jgi:hypothetical protein